MANLELHNPEDTCGFTSAAEYNAVLGRIFGAGFDPLSEEEFQELQSSAICPTAKSAAEAGLVEVGVESTYTPTGRGPEPSGVSATAASAIPPVVRAPSVFPPVGDACPPGYECIAGVIPGNVQPVRIMFPRVDWRGAKIIAGAAGLVCMTLIGWLVRKGM